MKISWRRSSWLPGCYYLRENGSAQCFRYGVGAWNNHLEGELQQEKSLAATPHSFAIVREENAHLAAAYCADGQQSTLVEDTGRGYLLLRRCEPLSSRNVFGLNRRSPTRTHEQAEELQYYKSCRSSFGLLYLKLSLPANPIFRADLPGKGRYYGVPASQEYNGHSECETSAMEGHSEPASWEYTDFRSKSVQHNFGSAAKRNGHNGIGPPRGASTGFSKLKERDWRPPPESRDLSQLTSPITSLYVCEVLREQNDTELAWQFFVWAGQQEGFQHNLYTYNSMFMKFCTAKKFTDAFELLKTMRRNGFYLKETPYSMIMQSLADEKMYDEAIRIFETANGYGCRASGVVYKNYLYALGSAGHLDRLDFALAQMQAAGYFPTVHTYNIFIKGFAKAEKVEKACQYYDQMKAKGLAPNFATCNTLLRALAVAGKIDKALQFFGEIIESGIVPSLHTYSTLKPVYARDGIFREGKKIDSDPQAIMHHSRIPLLCKEQDLDSALQLLTEMESRGCIRSVSLYNLVLSSLGIAGRVDAVLDLFRSLRNKGCFPDKVSYSIVISVVCKARRLDEAVQLHKEMAEQGLLPNTWLSSMLADLLARSGQVDRASEVISQMQGCTPEYYADDMLMSTLNNAKNPLKTLAWLKRAGVTSEFLTSETQGGISLLQRMQEVTRPDNIIYNIFLRMLYKAGRVDDAHSLLLDMRKNGLVPESKAYRNVLELLGKSGQINKAWRLFLQIKDTNADSITYTIIIKYLGRAGSFGKAYKLLAEMKSRGFAPDTVAYTELINSLGRAGKLEEMYSLFEEMQDNRCQPDTYTYSCLLFTFAKAGQVDRAYKLFEESIDKGCIPAVFSYNAVLGGYFRANRSDEALDLYTVMKGMGCIENEGTYHILFEGFTTTGRSDLASKVLAEMTSLGYRPRPHFLNRHSASLEKSEEELRFRRVI